MIVGATTDHVFPSIPGFTLKRVVGVGGFTDVYLAVGPDLRAVALKVLHPWHRPDPRILERFRREATKTADIAGGSLVARVRAHDLDSEPPWLATAYSPGPALSTAVAQHGPLPIEFVWPLAALLVEAVKAIHSADLLHRDLSPRNVLLDREGPTVIDLGLVGYRDSVARADSTLTKFTDLIGTAAYMPPEQILSLANAEAPADVYSLAATLYFAASGQRPLSGSLVDIHEAHKAGVLPDLGRVDRALRPFLRRCLAKDPRSRPSVDELAEMLPADALELFAEKLPAAVRSDQDCLRALLADEGITEFTREFPPPGRTRAFHREGIPGGIRQPESERCPDGGPEPDDDPTRPYSFFDKAGDRGSPFDEPDDEPDDGPHDGPHDGMTRPFLTEGNTGPRFHPLPPVRQVAVARGERILRAAARVASDAPGASAARLIRLAALFGLAPDTDDAERVLADERRVSAARVTSEEALSDLIARVADGTTQSATVVEITPDAAVVSRLTATSSGGVAVEVRALRWDVHIGVGSAGPAPDPDLVALALAGDPDDVPAGLLPPGADGGPPADGHLLARHLAQQVHTLLDDGTAPDRTARRSALVRTRPGWPLLDLVADLVRERVRPAAEAVLAPDKGVPELVDATLRGLPTRWPLALVAADVDATTGDVVLRPLELFAADRTALGSPVAEINALSVSSQTGGPLLLPVVAMRSPSPDDWDLIAVGVVDGPPPAAGLDVVVRLTACDRVWIGAPRWLPDGVPTAVTTWAEVRARIPRNVRRGGAAPRVVDLVVAVERGVSDGDIRPRRRFVRDLVAAAAGIGAGTRVAVVEYSDHLLDPTAPPKRPRYETGPPELRRVHDPTRTHHTFDTPQNRSRAATGLQPAIVEHDLAAPLEEALELLGEDGFGWRREAAHALVIVGSRPPHPPVLDDVYVRRCPYGADAAATLRRLEATLGLRTAAVLEPLDARLPPGRSLPEGAALKAEAMWAGLFRGPIRALADADPADVLRSVGAAPTPASRDAATARIPIPLAPAAVQRPRTAV
jgi:hypothetical protein